VVLGPFIAALIAFLVAYAAIHWMLRSGRVPLDRPNERSLHTEPVPRSGGVGIVAGVALVALLDPARGSLVLLAAFLGLAAVSYADDLFGLPTVWRLLAHVVAAAALLIFGLDHPHGLMSLILLLPAVVWMTNLYNFMDGADGLAGGMALFGFGALGIAAWLGGDAGIAGMALALAAGAAAFLRFNFPPARVFMGDVGSIPLGFMAAGLALLGWERELWSPSFPLLVFSPFIVDATVTLLRRLLSAEKIWLAHNKHYYQRLVRLGWGHRKTVMAEYALMAAACASAFFAESAEGGHVVLAIWPLLYVLLLGWIDFRWRRQRGGVR
jgi:UDP-GlcNAc:undecaprenyl-phosphate/decaprenyl-phosphate GlcNAc-1-phosphate transferase